MAMLNNQRVMDVSNEKFHVFSQPAGRGVILHDFGATYLTWKMRVLSNWGVDLTQTPIQGKFHLKSYWNGRPSSFWQGGGIFFPLSLYRFLLALNHK